jgi:hypothetical protein
VVNVGIWEKAVPFNPNWLVFRVGGYVACLGYVKQDFGDVIEVVGSGKSFILLFVRKGRCEEGLGLIY